MNQTKTAAIYARISLKDRDVPKTAQQVEQCRKMAETFGYDVTRVYEDDGISGYSADVERQGYEELLADIRAGHYQVVLAVEESRFTRQGVADKERLILACIQGGACWHTTREGFLDPSTDSGEFMAGLRALMDQQEIRKKTRRQKDRYAEERAKGRPLWGGRPFGYQGDRITIEPVEADAIRDCVRMILEEDASIYRCVRYLNDELGLKTPRGNNWGTNTVKELLTRPRNAGIYIVDGHELDVAAAWEPIVSRDTHEALLAHLGAKNNSTPGRKPRHVGNMLILCGVCGERMRSASDGRGIALYRCKSKAVDSHPNYTDNVRHSCIRAKFVEEVLREEIVNAFFVGHSLLSSSTAIGKDLSTLHKKISTLRVKRQSLVDAVADEDSPLTAADIAGAVKRLDASLKDAESTLQSLLAEKAHAQMLDEIRRSMGYLNLTTHRVDEDRAVDVRKALTERYDALTLDTKRVLIEDLLEVRIGAGRGRKKVLVRHKVVTTLNCDEDPA
ncbi:recombinase family protein [Microbacterium sp. 2216-1]|uniref:recombinase family protein n=1 Tax=Microbacterium sp. 2216-1 TaxID=3390053 RepID=UPI0039763DB9